ncbi:hypothetical protein EIO_1386 [Ketogulonicigenium vulgare Y25]|nr:hypothetical protein EIO_1386 [Ketogulonicigenium vulgare Y25]AOZ54432.1 hypothetical protein KVC_1418 [Ketogulonicigenium vulgare]
MCAAHVAARLGNFILWDSHVTNPGLYRAFKAQFRKVAFAIWRGHYTF